MSGFDRYIFKEGSKFYIDLEQCIQDKQIPFESGDVIKFIFEKKKYFGKIGDGKNGVAEISIQKEMDL